MRMYVMALAAVVAVLMLAPAVSAGPNGGWGKGLLSETMLFYVGDSDTPSGYMYWNPETDDFKYDFHGYDLAAGAVYYLIAFEGQPDETPDDYVVLGQATACDYLGVHIKGIIAWPGLADATVCLVPDTYADFGGTDDWMSETYLVAGPVDLP